MDTDTVGDNAPLSAPGDANPALRFELRHVDSAGKVVSQQATDDPEHAMRGFADLASTDFGSASGRGAYVALIDQQESRLAAAKTHEGWGVYQTRFVTDEGRMAFEALEPPVPGVTYPVERQVPGTTTLEPVQLPAREPKLPPEALKASPVLGAVATPAVNSIEFVSEHELTPGTPSAELRREARNRQVLSADRPDQALDTFARMSEPELKAFVEASKLSRPGADEVLRKVEERIVAEADRPTAYRAVPPLEDRFNVRRRLFSREYEFRDQAGKIAFTETLLRMESRVDSPAVVKAMVERAQERGWTTLRVNGSPEFQRQVWITATARGIKAVGYEPTAGDRLAAQEERDRLARAPSLEKTPAGGSITREAAGERETPARAERNDQQPTPERVPAPAARKFEPPIAEPLRRHLVDRGESAQAAEVIVAAAVEQIKGRRVYVGTAREVGTDHFDFDKKNERSPFVKLESTTGEKVVWGVDLPRALEEGRVKVGDAIALEHRGMQPVTVVVKDRDAEGRVVGEHEEVARRNAWFAVKVEQLREQALGRQEVNQEHAPADRSAAAAPVRSTPETPTALQPQVKEATSGERMPPAPHQDALVFELLEAAFETKKIPPELRDGLRAGVRKELDVRHARGETVSVKVYDPAAPSLNQRPFQPPPPKVERQREPDHGR